jgi:hypothetical protein
VHLTAEPPTPQCPPHSGGTGESSHPELGAGARGSAVDAGASATGKLEHLGLGHHGGVAWGGHSQGDHAYYPAGHMMYVHEPSRVQQSKDLAAFIRGASAQ